MASRLTKMPKLTDFRRTKTVSLPSIADSKIEIYDSLLVGDALGQKDVEGKELESMLNALPLLIKSWNFTGDDDKPLPITKENLNFIKPEDLTFLLEQITAFANENKKK